MQRHPIRFAESADGTSIAWTRSGSGPSLLRAGMFMTHIEREAENRVFGRWLSDLGSRFDYIRYDERGCGLSQRDVAEVDEGRWLEDLVSVIDAIAVPRVALFGMSQGAALAVAFAAAFPDRVSHLILLGGYAAGGMAPGRPADRGERTRALAEMNRLFWEQPDPSFRRSWTARLIPDGEPEDLDALDEMQRASSTGDMAARILLARDVMDVRERATTLELPTLVAHARDDAIVGYDSGVELASLIPGAELLTLESRNHLLVDEPAWHVLMGAVTGFIAASDSSASGPSRSPGFSEREGEILDLVAEGLPNEEIGHRLALSVRTVERHLSNAYRKLGVSGKSARAAAAAQRRVTRQDRGAT